MQLVKLWFLGSGLALAALLTWSFAPVLVPMALVALALAAVVAGIVALARVIERRRGSNGG